MSIEKNLATHISDQATQLILMQMYLVEQELITDFTEWAEAKVRRLNIQLPKDYEKEK